MNPKTVRTFVIGTFVTLYLLVSTISTIHVIDFFRLSNPNWLAISLALAFEVGAAASLASLVTLEKMNKGIVWMLFIILTLMQAMGNVYYTYIHLHDFSGWIELFGLNEDDPIYQKRILAIVSGAVLPIVALGFIKSLVDYIKPSQPEVTEPSQITQDEAQPITIDQISEQVEPKIQEEIIVEKISPEPNPVIHPVKKEEETKVDNIKPKPSPDEVIARGLR